MINPPSVTGLRAAWSELSRLDGALSSYLTLYQSGESRISATFDYLPALVAEDASSGKHPVQPPRSQCWSTRRDLEVAV